MCSYSDVRVVSLYRCSRHPGRSRQLKLRIEKAKRNRIRVGSEDSAEVGDFATKEGSPELLQASSQLTTGRLRTGTQPEQSCLCRPSTSDEKQVRHVCCLSARARCEPRRLFVDRE
jgi:hypothetical protein